MITTTSLRTFLAPKPPAATLLLQLRRAVLRAALIVGCFGAAYSVGMSATGSTFGVGDLDYATPEHGAAAQAQADVEADRGLAIAEDAGPGRRPPTRSGRSRGESS